MAQPKVKVKTPEAKNFENAERENNFIVEKVWRENYLIWNHKDSDSIHIDLNYTNSNKPITDDLTNIGIIHDSANICVIENILSSPVHLVHAPSPVPASPIFAYGTASDPRSPSHGS